MAREQGPSVLLRGCSFSNCTISFSGNPVASCEKENRSSPGDVDTTELLEGISVDELYDDVKFTCVHWFSGVITRYQ